MDGYLTTRQLVAATGVRNYTITRMMQRYPELLTPYSRVCQAYLWPREAIAVILRLKRKGKRVAV